MLKDWSQQQQKSKCPFIREGRAVLWSPKGPAAVPQAPLAINPGLQAVFLLPKVRGWSRLSRSWCLPQIMLSECQRHQPCNRAPKIMPLLITFLAISYGGTATNSGVKALPPCPGVLISSMILLRMSKDWDGQPLIQNRPANWKGWEQVSAFSLDFLLQKYKTSMSTQILLNLFSAWKKDYETRRSREGKKESM